MSRKTNMKNTRILIVEDDRLTANHIVQLLYLSGYEVTSIVASGTLAIQKAKDEVPDIILMDILLEGDLDGIDTAEQIWTKQNIPIIYLSSHAELGLIERAKATSQFGYLLKPVQKGELQATIEMALHKHLAEIELRQINQRLEQEIIERKRVEEALQKSEYQFRGFFENIPIGTVIATDPTKSFTVNQALADFLGYTREELESLPALETLKKISHAEDFQKEMKFFEKMMSGEISTYRMEKRYITKNGEIVVGMLTTTFLRNAEGQFLLGMSAVQDITERKRAEIELATAKETAETANRVKSTFLADISHELRTPLNGILGYTQILKRDPDLTASQRTRLENIERSGNLLLNIINDILDLSKIEAQKMELHESNLNFPQFLTKTTEMIRVQAQHKGVAFRYETTTALPSVVYADERQLSEVLLNLLSNAIKFTDHGGVSLKVGCCQSDRTKAFPDSTFPLEEKEMCTIRFQVSDSGIGIPEHQLQEIFSPFTQLAQHSPRTEGTGLGLAISRKLVKLMGSELYVQSVVGKGSTFWFDVDFPVGQTVMLPESQGTRSITGFKGDPKTLLLVDDQQDNRSVLKDMLGGLGFEILEAIDGQDALKKTIEYHPDLILMDLIMPMIDGFEVTRRIRAISQLKDIPIIAISASVFKDTQQKSLEAGCNDFLPKPVNFEQLLEKLAAQLHLEWIYARNQPPAQPESSENDYTLPPQKELQALYQAAKIGDILKLRKQLDCLAQSDTAFQPFIKKIHKLAQNFEINKIYNILKTYLEQ